MSKESVSAPMAVLPGLEAEFDLPPAAPTRPSSGPSSAAAGLQLARPLVSFDLETTGLDVAADRIVEIACVKLTPDGKKDVRTHRLNPQKPISEEATRVHGITDADVENAPRFADIAASLHRFLHACDLTGFNLESFDLPLLANEFKRCGYTFPEPGSHVVDSWRIFLTMEPRTLSAAYRFYCGKALHDAHSAEADALAAAEVLQAQVQRYAEVPKSIPELDSFCHPRQPDWLDPDGKIVWRDGHAVLSFGKYRNRPLQQLAAENRGYLEWILTANFSQEVLRIVRDCLDGKLPERPAALDASTAEADGTPAGE